jgi:ribonucleoside-diphosphate reductase beta chain
MHVQGNAKLFRTFCEEHPRIVTDELKSKIYEMAKISVNLEDRFIKLAYRNNEIEGLSQEEVKEYIRHIADRRLLQLGLKPKYRAKDNPLPWLDWVLNGASHDNFFEKRVSEYSVNGMDGTWNWDEVLAE